MILLLVIGNPLDIKCWSGTPFFLLKALEAKNHSVIAPDTSYGRFNVIRFLWCVYRLLCGRRPYGFQYSDTFERYFIRRHLESLSPADVVLSLNTHIPSKKLITELQLTVVHYDDSTIHQIVSDPNYYWSSISLRDNWVFEKEKAALEASRWLIGMTEYAEQGFKHHLGVDSNQTRYILGGVNLSQQLERELATACTGQLRSPDELHFGLIAVDPEFKGYNELKELMQVLEGRGIRCYAHVIGGFPKEPCERTECYGFVDKSKEPEKFLEILSRMSYGWLYPKFEAFGITVLEFYSFGVPMIALGEFGPKSTASNQLGLALEIHESMEEIADRILKHWRTGEYHQCEHRIREIRKQLTWERAVDEILSLLDSPEELIPFRLPR